MANTPLCSSGPIITESHGEEGRLGGKEREKQRRRRRRKLGRERRGTTGSSRLSFMGKNMLIAVGLEKQDNHYHPIICILGSSRPHIVLGCEGTLSTLFVCDSPPHCTGRYSMLCRRCITLIKHSSPAERLQMASSESKKLIFKISNHFGLHVFYQVLVSQIKCIIRHNVCSTLHIRYI